MPSTYSTGYPPHSVYRTRLSTQQTLVFTSGGHAEFQDGSDARFRSASKIMMRSGSSAQFESGSKLDLQSGAKGEVSTGAYLDIKGYSLHKPYKKSTASTSIENRGVSYVYSSEDLQMSLKAPTTAGIFKKIIVGSATSKGMIYISTTKGVGIHQSSMHCITFSSHAQLEAVNCNPWIELYSASSALYLISAFKTSAAEIMAISSSTDFSV